MSPKELMLAAISHQPLPVLVAATYNFHPFRTSWRSFTEEPEYAPMLEAVAAAPNVGIVCKTGPTIRRPVDDYITVEQNADNNSRMTVTRLTTPQGELQTVYRDPSGQPGYIVEPLLKTDQDINKYLSLPCEPGQVDLSPAVEIYEKLGDKGLAYLSYEDPLLVVAEMFHYEDFTIRCLEDLPSLKRLLDREFDRIKQELAVVLQQAGDCEFLFYSAGPELATPPMLPPEMFRELVTVYQSRLVQMIHQAGYLVSIHCHGRVRLVLDQFLEIGPNVLEPMEPPPQGDITLGEALDAVDGRICLMGYIQDQDLYTAQPGEMAAKVKQIRQTAAGRSGYIMTPTATPYMHPPPPEFVRNYVEFIEAASQPLP